MALYCRRNLFTIIPQYVIMLGKHYQYKILVGKWLEENKVELNSGQGAKVAILFKYRKHESGPILPIQHADFARATGCFKVQEIVGQVMLG